jgi:nucleoside-diphosphate-sugar epimerase
MKILLTGATGYIGKRLLPILIAQGHESHLLCEIKQILHSKEFEKNIE